MNGGSQDAVDEPSETVRIAAEAIRDQVSDIDWIDRRGKTTAIVLGSGLGSLAEKIESPRSVAYESIPGFARSTASGHRGELIFGTIGNAPVIAMAGRLHRYEGWSDDQIAFPIAVMHALGAVRLIASNAAGGVNPKLRVGDIVIIRDHINWLHQRNRDQHTVAPGIQSSRNQAKIYDEELAGLALKASRAGGFAAIEGTYLATLGPTYETRAEYRMMRRIGADVVGMSTVGEVLPASKLKMRILALSIVSNVADPDRAKVADHEEVLEAGLAAAAKMEAIVRCALDPRLV